MSYKVEIIEKKDPINQLEASKSRTLCTESCVRKIQTKWRNWI